MYDRCEHYSETIVTYHLSVRIEEGFREYRSINRFGQFDRIEGRWAKKKKKKARRPLHVRLNESGINMLIDQLDISDNIRIFRFDPLCLR